MWPVLSYSISFVIFLVAATYDIAWRRIPNAVPFCLVGIGLVNHLIDHRLEIATVYAMAVFILCLIAWTFQVLGGGDVKLLAAAAFAIPCNDVGSLVLVIALSGGVLSLCYIVLSRVLPAVSPVRPRTYLRRVLRTEQRRIVRRLSLPYGVAIALGSIITMTVG